MIKSEIFELLQSGKTKADIAVYLGTVLDEAAAEYEEIQKKKHEEARKDELVGTFVKTLREFGLLCGMPEEALTVSEKELETIKNQLTAYTTMFAGLAKNPTCNRDADILSEFVKSL